MKQLMRKEELMDIFGSLSDTDCDYILAIAKALAFAQGKEEKPPPASEQTHKTA